jgi:hypothetical protein
VCDKSPELRRAACEALSAAHNSIDAQVVGLYVKHASGAEGVSAVLLFPYWLSKSCCFQSVACCAVARVCNLVGVAQLALRRALSELLVQPAMNTRGVDSMQSPDQAGKALYGKGSMQDDPARASISTLKPASQDALLPEVRGQLLLLMAT